MSELKTNPLDHAPDESSKAKIDVEARSVIIKAAALLAASASKPNKRNIKKVINDFKLAVAEVEKSY